MSSYCSYDLILELFRLYLCFSRHQNKRHVYIFFTQQKLKSFSCTWKTIDSTQVYKINMFQLKQHSSWWQDCIYYRYWHPRCARLGCKKPPPIVALLKRKRNKSHVSETSTWKAMNSLMFSTGAAPVYCLRSPKIASSSQMHTRKHT